jgi:hypothetical protein
MLKHTLYDISSRVKQARWRGSLPRSAVKGERENDAENLHRPGLQSTIRFSRI